MVSTVFLNQRRGEVIEASSSAIKAYLPVTESFDFSEHLRSMTAGRAFPQCVFDHWQLMDEDPLDPRNTKMVELVANLRKRKGLAPEIPPLDRYLDKL